MEMKFGGPLMNMQHMPLAGGHQMEMLQQPLPTSIPPPQINPNQFSSTVPSQNLPPSTPGEQQPKEHRSEEKESTTTLVEPSAGENDDSDKMDICDTWEQEKVQRLAEEVEKFEKEVMNIERNSLKSCKGEIKAETGNNVTEADERTPDKMMETVKNENKDGKERVNETRKDDSGIFGDSEIVREDKQNVTDTDIKRPEESKVESKNWEAGEDKDKEQHLSAVPLMSGENPTPAEGISVEQESEQNKMEDEKSLPAKTNEVASFDDAMDLQESSPEPVDNQTQHLTTDNA